MELLDEASDVADARRKEGVAKIRKMQELEAEKQSCAGEKQALEASLEGLQAEQERLHHSFSHGLALRPRDACRSVSLSCSRHAAHYA